MTTGATQPHDTDDRDGEQNGEAELHELPRRIRRFLDEPVLSEDTDLSTTERFERIEAVLYQAITEQLARDDERDAAASGDVSREEFNALKDEVRQLAGLADGEESTQTKRVIDLCIGLRNQADARDNGIVQWDYNDVLDHWERTNHGKLHGKQAYRAMETAAELDGFSETTDDAGNRVVRCNAGSAPSDVEAAVDNVNNGSGGGTSAQTDDTGVNASAR